MDDGRMRPAGGGVYISALQNEWVKTLKYFIFLWSLFLCLWSLIKMYVEYFMKVYEVTSKN
jgi:hypothetical protein